MQQHRKGRFTSNWLRGSNVRRVLGGRHIPVAYQARMLVGYIRDLECFVMRRHARQQNHDALANRCILPAAGILRPELRQRRFGISFKLFWDVSTCFFRFFLFCTMSRIQQGCSTGLALPALAHKLVNSWLNGHAAVVGTVFRKFAYSSSGRSHTAWMRI